MPPSFCPRCNKRNDLTLSSTHLNCGGSEAFCQCPPLEIAAQSPTANLFPDPPSTPEKRKDKSPSSSKSFFSPTPSQQHGEEYFVDTQAARSASSVNFEAHVSARSKASRRFAKRKRSVRQRARSLRIHSENFLCDHYQQLAKIRTEIDRHTSQTTELLEQLDRDLADIVAEEETSLFHLSQASLEDSLSDTSQASQEPASDGHSSPSK